MKPSEIIFEVTEAVEGGYDARALGYSIFTQGEDWADLKEMVGDAIRCHFEDECMPDSVSMLLVKPYHKGNPLTRRISYVRSH